MSLTGAMERNSSAALDKLHVGFPGVVTSYEAEFQRCDVQPLLKDSAGRSLPQLRRVPILFPRGGGAYITWPIVAGDKLWILISDRCMEEYLDRGGADPIGSKDPRKFDLSDAVGIPGIGAWPDALPTTSAHLVVEHPTSGEIYLGAAATQLVALADLVTGVLNDIQSKFNSHTHGGVTAGSAFTGNPTASTPPTTMAMSTAVAATKVRAL